MLYVRTVNVSQKMLEVMYFHQKKLPCTKRIRDHNKLTDDLKVDQYLSQNADLKWVIITINVLQFIFNKIAFYNAIRCTHGYWHTSPSPNLNVTFVGTFSMFLGQFYTITVNTKPCLSTDCPACSSIQQSIVFHVKA